MLRFPLQILRVGALLLAAAMPASAQPGAAAPPVEHFFGNPAFSGALLSPDARSLAVVVSGDNTRDKLAVIDLAANTVKIVAQFAKSDIGNVEWVNSQRLAFSSRDKKIGQGERQFAPGIYAVNRDGTAFRQLVDVRGNGTSEHNASRTILPWNHYLSGQRGAQNSDSVYALSPRYHDSGELDVMNLVRIDTVSGRATTVQRPGNTVAWLLDYKGDPRLATTLDKNLMAIHYLDPATSAWRQIASFDGYVGGSGAFSPLAFGPDGSLYVISSEGDKDSPHTFDFKTGKVDPSAMVALEDFDFNGQLITSEGKLLGIRYLSDARSTVWLGEKMKAVQAAVDARLPDTINLISVAARPELPLVMVASYSDRQPYKYSLYDTASGKLNMVGETHPAIQPAQMAGQEFVRVKARDGLMVPAWLTTPTGKRSKLPMLVLVHGGPYVRGTEWQWSNEAQFLASRGYAVLEPEFRGSAGYGDKHYTAGWKQWGLAMQNDIADATRWAIAQGIADPNRICIAGASYGGYATLMGLVNDPDLYKCGINWVGVSDIKLMYSGHWSFSSDMSDGYRQYGMPTLVGDPVKDAKQLAATSPLVQAARIKQPLLMAYGAADQRVPLYHGRLFHDAVKVGNPNVEMVVYDEEGHGWTLPKTRYDFWTRVERFLDKQIGKP